MKIIGITGTIGSGKSTVAGFLRELGASLIDADKIGHEVYQPGSEGWQRVVSIFGQEILTSDNYIDRQKLGEIVFSDAEALVKLDKIMHPLIAGAVKAQLASYRRQGIKVVVIEAALLIEAGWVPLVDEVWVTTAPQDVILKRLKAKNGFTRSQALARIKAQIPLSEQIKHATRVIDTDTNLDKLKAKIRQLWQEIAS